MKFDPREQIKWIFKINSKTGIIKKEEISHLERSNLVDLYQFPGSFNYDKSIFSAQIEGRKFTDSGYYCNKVEGTLDYQTYWNTEKEKAYSGVLIDEKFYICGDAYFYLNYAILNHKDGPVEVPTLRDSDIWYYNLLEHAELFRVDGVSKTKFTVTSKVRQWGMTVKILFKLIKKLWFERGSSCKYISCDDKYIKDGWKELEKYRDHLNTNVGWFRPLAPNKQGHWIQRQELKDKTFVGLNSEIRGITTKNNPSSVVAGKTDVAFIDEAGIDTNLLEVFGYIEPALRNGNIVYGKMHIGGAAGDSTQSEGIKELMDYPVAYNMLPVPYFNDPSILTGIFVSALFSYGDCVDEFGNSNIEAARIAYAKDAELVKTRSYTKYLQFKSQYPLTLKDYFATRTESIYPVEIIKPQLEYLSKSFKVPTVRITPSETGFIHKFDDDRKVIEDFPVKKETDKRGAICMIEPPIKNPPHGLYYAGVDVINKSISETSISLQSIHIFKAAHNIDGEYSEEKLVAWYCGRTNNDPEEVYRICSNLIEYYNARACIENNLKAFIDWMLSNNFSHRIMRRSDLPINKDLIINSTINKSEYGIRMTDKFKHEVLHPTIIEYMSEVISTDFIETMVDGELVITHKNIYGVTRIPDKMLLTETVNYNPSPKWNADRIVSFGLALFAARTNTNRGIIVTDTKKNHKKSVNYMDTLRNTQLYDSGFSGYSKLGGAKLGY